MNEITVLTFGAVADIVGKASFVVNDVASTSELQEKLEQEFPGLKNIRFAVAVNKQLTTASAPLERGATVALLPPFSGG